MSLPPGPTLPAPLQTLLWLRQSERFFEHLRRYDSIATLRLGARRVVAVFSPELVKEVLTTDPSIMRGSEDEQLADPLTGPHSIFRIQGEVHLQARRMMAPMFRRTNMHEYMEVMGRHMDTLIAAVPTASSGALFPPLRAFTTRITAHTILGYTTESDVETCVRDIDELSAANSSLFMIACSLAGKNGFQSFPRSRAGRVYHRVNEAIYAQIAECQRQGDTGRIDILAQLCALRDEQGAPLSPEAIRDQVVSFIGAGYDTTPAVAAWAVREILAHPTVEERLRDELRDAIGNGDINSAEQFEDLPYLDAVLKESMRLHPLMSIVLRRLAAPITLAGYELPAGIAVGPALFLTQRNPAVYSEPNAFRPERFLNVRPDPYAWLPFGGGARRCLGMAYGIFQLKYILASLFHRTRLVLDGPRQIGNKREGVVLAPADGTRVHRSSAHN